MRDVLRSILCLPALLAFGGCSEDQSVAPLPPPCCDEGPLCYDDTFSYLGFRQIDSEPAWSPNGSTIAYYHAGLAEMGDTNGIYLVGPGGAGNRLLLPGMYENPDWSPDGEWLAFACAARLYRMRANGQDLAEIPALPGERWDPSWSPDASLIVYDCPGGSERGIWVVPSDGQHPATDSRRLISPGEHPSWSHCARQIVFLGYLEAGTGICVMDSSGANPRLLFEGGDNARYPAFSPDDTMIAFSYGKPGRVPQIWVMNADGTDPRQLTTCGGLHPAWSPDGRYIAYADSRRCNGRVWIMRADGSGKRQVTDPGWWPEDK